MTAAETMTRAAWSFWLYPWLALMALVLPPEPRPGGEVIDLDSRRPKDAA